MGIHEYKHIGVILLFLVLLLFLCCDKILDILNEFKTSNRVIIRNVVYFFLFIRNPSVLSKSTVH